MAASRSPCICGPICFVLCDQPFGKGEELLAEVQVFFSPLFFPCHFRYCHILDRCCTTDNPGGQPQIVAPPLSHRGSKGLDSKWASGLEAHFVHFRSSNARPQRVCTYYQVLFEPGKRGDSSIFEEKAAASALLLANYF